VDPAGTVVESSPGWAGHSVTRLATGHYCVTPGTTPAWIVPNLNGSDGVVANITGGATGCNTGFGNVWVIDTATKALVDDTLVIFVAP
jgi:hypothetical protein